MNFDDLLLQIRSDIEESIAYLNDHEIIRGYRAIERAYKHIDTAIKRREASRER